MFWHGLTLSELRASCCLLGANDLKGMYSLLGSKQAKQSKAQPSWRDTTIYCRTDLRLILRNEGVAIH